jgi:hypothetical protein
VGEIAERFEAASIEVGWAIVADMNTKKIVRWVLKDFMTFGITRNILNREHLRGEGLHFISSSHDGPPLSVLPV